MYWFGLSHCKDTAGLLRQMSWFWQWDSLLMGKKSKASLVVLITSFLSGCHCWLSSVVRAALKRPPHVTVCCSPHSFIPILFLDTCSKFCLFGGSLWWPEEWGESTTAACMQNRQATGRDSGIRRVWIGLLGLRVPKGSKSQLVVWVLVWTIDSAASQQHHCMHSLYTSISVELCSSCSCTKPSVFFTVYCQMPKRLSNKAVCY